MAHMDLRQLKKDLARVEAELVKLEKKAQNFRGVIAHYEESSKGIEVSKTPGKELDDTIVLILETEGKPLHPKTVCERLGERGIKVPGQNPVSNVRAHMSGDERCVPTRKDGLWGLKAWQAPKTLLPPRNGEQPNQPNPPGNPSSANGHTMVTRIPGGGISQANRYN